MSAQQQPATLAWHKQKVEGAFPKKGHYQFRLSTLAEYTSISPTQNKFCTPVAETQNKFCTPVAETQNKFCTPVAETQIDQ